MVKLRECFESLLSKYVIRSKVLNILSQKVHLSVIFIFGVKLLKLNTINSPDDDFSKRPKHLEEFEIHSMTEFQLKYGKLPDIDEFQFVKPIPIKDGSPNRINRRKK